MIMLIREALNEFYRDRESYCSEDTIKCYRGHMVYFLAFLEAHFGGLDSLTFEELPDDVKLVPEYILYLKQNHSCKNVTIRSYCRPVRAFLKFCYEEDLCKDYLKRIKMPKDDSALHMPLFHDEVAAIDQTFGDLKTEKDLRNYCIFHLMLDCGLRSQEVRNLQIHNLDYDRNILTIINSKGMKSRIVLMPDFLKNYLRTYLSSRSSGAVFLDLKKNEPLTANTIKQLFQDLKQTSGIKRLHAHLCRHTFATSYLVGGGNLEFLRALLGHYDYAVTKGYVQMAAQVKMLGLVIYRLDDIFFQRGY